MEGTFPQHLGKYLHSDFKGNQLEILVTEVFHEPLLKS